MRWKLAFDDVMAKRFGDLYIDGKFPVNACRRKVLHRRYYAKRLEAKQVLVAAALSNSPRIVVIGLLKFDEVSAAVARVGCRQLAGKMPTFQQI